MKEQDVLDVEVHQIEKEVLQLSVQYHHQEEILLIQSQQQH